MPSTTIYKNCRICRAGQLTDPNDLVVSEDGYIIDQPPDDTSSCNVVDLDGAIVAPGYIELQTNGMRGFHFTHFDDSGSYAAKVDEIARYLVTQGVTAFYATIPTVSSEEFKKILPSLRPREIPNGATLLGAHAEGPYLHPSKKGAHNSSLFQHPSTDPMSIYGDIATDNSVLKLVTLAPELKDSTKLVSTLTEKNIVVSLGHSAASYDAGLAAIHAGATCLTHTLNAMAPLHHRVPGLAGLITSPPTTIPSPPYFSLIPDGNHLHPSVASLLFRSNPAKCIVITDSIEMAGLPDGTYPGHAQIPFNQTKKGSRVVIEGTETLIGGCASLAECVRNLVRWSGCGVAEGVRCVTENVVGLMGDDVRGALEVGRRADFVVLGDGGEVRGTWMKGRKVWGA